VFRGFYFPRILAENIYMELPKFLIGDNTDYPDAIFVVHTEFPRFVINLANDEVEWLEEFDQHDQKELETETEHCIKEASEFYDREVARYEND
jgi:alpha/beta superfamily hydrolase